MTNNKNNTLLLAQSALFVALIAICSQIAVPLPSGVPINLALLAVYLCALIMPLKYSLATVGVYLLLGLIGVPVFAGLKAGPAALFGKTGGYLIGYLLCAAVIGIFRLKLSSFLKRAIVMAIGLIVCYTFGTAWFMHLTGLGLKESLGYCVIPFLPGDAIKIAAAGLLAPKIMHVLY
ncbi:MAG: biotin transporter BioY [Eubacteriales bacterium]|nr:biotin transporter BioY [Eubacteriales bacterium]